MKARFGKGRRAEPVFAQFTAERARFADAFPELEDELCGVTPDAYHEPRQIPDRVDAVVDLDDLLAE